MFAGHHPRRDDTEEPSVTRNGPAVAAGHTVEALARFKVGHRAMLDALCDAVLACDNDSVVVYANPAAADLLGRGVEHLVGADVHELLHARRPDGSAYDWRECPSHMTVQTAREVHAPEETVWDAAGTAHVVDYRSRPIHSEGAVAGFLVQLQRRAPLPTASTQTQEEAAQRRLCAAMAGANLRPPLAALQGTAAMLLSGVAGELPGDVRDLIASLRGTVDDLVREVDTLSEHDALLHGRLALRWERLDLAVVVADALERHTEAARDAGVRLQSDTDEAFVIGDHARLVELLGHLLANALLHGRGGSAVRVTLRRRVQDAEIDVADGGPGIPDAVADRLFEPFVQSSPGGVRCQRGVGLGLPIARQLAERHGGRLRLAASGPAGSTFRLTLPLAGVRSVAAR